MRPGFAIVVGGMAASSMACGALVGLGDRPSERTDSGLEGGETLDASEASDAPHTVDLSDADPADAPAGDAHLPGSCLDIVEQNSGAQSAVYELEVDGVVIQTWCDMDTVGGGWTVFFVTTLGASSFIGTFDQATANTCPNPQFDCLRHIPFDLPQDTRFGAVCGDSAIGFDWSYELNDYFRGLGAASGLTGWWDGLTNVVSLGGTPVLTDATQFFGGFSTSTANDGGGTGWIISAGELTDGGMSNTFASSYGVPSSGWDYCNGVNWNGSVANPPRVALMYR